MKEKILQKATEMFLNLGFKSVTMDEISNELAISKKTVYTHFKTKNKLVECVTLEIFKNVYYGINSICNKKKNSIDELFEIKEFINKNMNNQKSSSFFQLQKFFPDIHYKMRKKSLEVMMVCVKDNIERGIKNGLYRDNINPDFIARIYFTGISSIKDEDTFPKTYFEEIDLNNQFLEYHTRAIATEKGLETLNKILNNNRN